MKKLYLFFVLLSFLNCYAQTSYEKEFEEAKLYVNETFKNNHSEILNYLKLSDGKLKLCKTNDPIKEFDNDWAMFYKIVRKNDKIIYISKSNDLWGGIGDSKTSYDYYFNENGILVGAEKILEFFLEDTKCTPQVKYYALYKNVNAEKLYKTEVFRNMDGKKIDFNSAKCKDAKKIVDDSVSYLDKITFRNVEDFMKAEKIKYYRSDKDESKMGISESKNNNDDGKDNSNTGNLLKGRGSKTATQENGDDGSKIGIERKLVEFIPGTMGRGGSPPSKTCSASGSINISYTVDKEGNVVSARRSGGVSDPCIVSTSISWVKQYVKAEKSTISSRGTYMITF